MTVASTELAMDMTGADLGKSADAVDAEALVRLPDGSFWIAEENAPSILHVGADGRVLRRIVPTGTEGDFAEAKYEVTGGLPAIFAMRQANRGLESLALTPDGATLAALMQSPLANPDGKTYQESKNARLVLLDAATLAVTGEYVYTLDDPGSFALDPSDKQNDVRISEVLALGADRFLVLERTDGTTKLYEIALSGATDLAGSAWDDAATSPSLEATADLAAAGIVPVTKTLRFDSAEHPEVPGKVEGLALAGDGSLLLINDNDFGITGAETKVLIFSGSDIRAD